MFSILKKAMISAAELARVAGVDVCTIWLIVRLLMPLAVQLREPFPPSLSSEAIRTTASFRRNPNDKTNEEDLPALRLRRQ